MRTLERSARLAGSQRLHCKTWAAEAAYRMLQNSVHPEVAEDPGALVVYGGRGKAARNRESYEAILRTLRELDPDRTLLVQSGKPVGVIRTHEDAPRVLIANSNLVPRWATWEHFDELDRRGLMMYGQMTAGSWIYIGSQGIVQGTFETFAACGRLHFPGRPLPLSGRLVVSSGLGGMGGAQPLAAKIAGATFLGIEVDPARLRRRHEIGYLDEVANDLDDALKRVTRYAAKESPRSVGLVGNAAEVLPELVERGIMPDIVTDQTSAHDPLNGYIPAGYSVSEAQRFRAADPAAYLEAVYQSAAAHVSAMIKMKACGSVVFDYGNNLRELARIAGVEDAFTIPGFVAEYIRPLFCEGAGPFRWVALSGDPHDIAVTDQAMLHAFPESENVQHWLSHGAPQVPFQGLPARICWLRHGEREKAGLLLNDLVKRRLVSAPLVIGRDHLDCGSVASPHRETEGMLDGSDAVSDWPILNVLANAANGASWVSFHHGGGVGMGYSQHSGMVIVADGTEAASLRLSRVLEADPAIGVIRHADAGYRKAQDWAAGRGIHMPMNRT